MDEKLVLHTEGLVEPNENGTVNLLAEVSSIVTVNYSESITLTTQTMDAGETFTIWGLMLIRGFLYDFFVS